MNSTLVEPTSINGSDESATDGSRAAAGGSGVSDDGDRSTLEAMSSDAGQRNAFDKTRSRIERNLHVLNPLTRTVSQLGHEMLGGVQIIDFDSPRYTCTGGYWTTRGYANSRIDNSRTGDSRTGHLA